MKKIQKLERKKEVIRKAVILGIIIAVGLSTLYMCTGIYWYIKKAADLKFLLGSLVMIVVLAMSQVIWEYFQEYEAKLYRTIEEEKAKAEIKDEWNLSKEDYVEILWKDEENKREISNAHFVATAGADFFVKLVTDEVVEIIATNSNGKMIYGPKITDFSYLKDHYKKKPEKLV